MRSHNQPSEILPFVVAMVCSIAVVFCQSCIIEAFGGDINPLNATANANEAQFQAQRAAVVPPPPASNIALVTLSWTDEKISNTNVAGYNFYCGTNPLAMPLQFTLTNWTNIGGTVSVTLSNLTTQEYFAAVAAFDKFGDESAESSYVEFIPPGFLIISAVSNGVEISFQTLPTNSFTLQGKALPSGTWMQIVSLAPTNGIATITDTNPALVGKIYRTKRQ